MGKLSRNLDSILYHGETWYSPLILPFVLFLKKRILCLQGANVFPMLDDVSDDPMEGIDLVPLRIDLARCFSSLISSWSAMMR
jgi:hypothetical protein